MKRAAAIIQARMGSTRLPEKVMKPLAGKPALWHVVERTRACKNISQVIIATSTLPADTEIAEYCAAQSILCFRGEEEDVLGRYYQAAVHYNAEEIVRITSDCPLIDPEVVDRLIGEYFNSGADYASNIRPTRTYPHGHDCEICSFAALERIEREARDPYEREHVTPYFYRHPELFKIASIAQEQDYSWIRITLDTPEDYQIISEIYDKYYAEGSIISTASVIQHFETCRLEAH